MKPAIRLHRNQQRIRKRKVRFRVAACGRRFGKTTVGKIILIDHAVNGKRCWWLSPTYLMASQVWRDVKALVVSESGVTINETEHRIDLPGGGMIAIRSTHLPDNLRGEGLDFAVLDEAAFMEPRVWPEIVRPMLLERRGGAIFLSTPYGRNWFWELFKLGLDREEPDWAAFHFASAANPYIAPEELAAIRRNTPERIFREEYLAEFHGDAGQVFRGIKEAATAPLNTQPEAGRRYVGGIDWGREYDYTVIVIIDAQENRIVAIDRFNQVGWALQRGRLKRLCEIWQPVAVWAESNSIGSVNIEALQSEGLPVRPFITTAKSKKEIIESLGLAIERQELALLPDEVLLGELASYKLERLPEGGYRYNAPPGAHDDCVIATAIAWYGALRSGPPISFA